MTKDEITQLEKGSQNPVKFQQRDGSIITGHVVYYPAQNPINEEKAEVYLDGIGYESWLIKYIFEK